MVDGADGGSDRAASRHRERTAGVMRISAVTRVAWNGTRPVVAEAARGWRGGLDDDTLPIEEISRATDAALELMTPGMFVDGVRAVALEPTVAALVVDTATRALLTGAAARLPEVAHRLVAGATVASPVLTLIDDPTAAGAYGGFAFDDDGVAAAPIVLLDHGKVAGRLDDAMTAPPGSRGGRTRRPGHVGRGEPWPSHLALASWAIGRSTRCSPTATASPAASASSSTRAATASSCRSRAPTRSRTVTSPAASMPTSSSSVTSPSCSRRRSRSAPIARHCRCATSWPWAQRPWPWAQRPWP